MAKMIGRPFPIKHGMTKTSEFTIWVGMRNRCNNQNNPAYHWYGGRGIKVCERWNSSFKNFLNDMGRRPPGSVHRED